jgi:RNA polymerase sigma-70 factor, ECF subfamily
LVNCHDPLGSSRHPDGILNAALTADENSNGPRLAVLDASVVCKVPNKGPHTVQRTQPSITPDDLVLLLKRIASQDREAFNSLYAATAAKLYGVILRITVRRDLADELLQETYVKIWNRAGAFDPTRGAAVTWMATIARHTALDSVRRVTHVSIEDRPDVLEFASDAPGPDDRLEQSESARRLSHCLEGLDAEKRKIVVLAYIEGHSREELAKHFARPVATIKTWLHRSLAQLKDCLSQ